MLYTLSWNCSIILELKQSVWSLSSQRAFWTNNILRGIGIFWQKPFSNLSANYWFFFEYSNILTVKLSSTSTIVSTYNCFLKINWWQKQILKHSCKTQMLHSYLYWLFFNSHSKRSNFLCSKFLWLLIKFVVISVLRF